MCTTCGCSSSAHTSLTHLAAGATGHTHLHGESHQHHHEHAHEHAQAPHHEHAHEHHHHNAQKIISLEADLLAKNDHLAAHNRAWFAARKILTLNLVSSPGSGKTTLLERTLRDLHGERPLAVVEGDQATLNDAERIRATGCDVIQINTGTGCHLEAEMLRNGVEQLHLQDGSLLFVENVGNLVCPALFDLGERAKVAILSVTEGEDKPLKYPHMFRASQLMLLNKIDLLPHLQFDVERCLDAARQVNPHLEIVQLSAQTGEGLDAWYDWLRRQAP
jgi:hydrogenase nickel incorporation protein HypB